MPGSSSSACTRPSSRSSASPRTCARRSKRLGIRYPVAQDNDFQTWRAYDNDYWPAKYLIDKTGRVRYTHFGEGAYGETESWIRRLLGEKAKTRRTSVQDQTPGDITTPESYLGYARLDRYAGARDLRPRGPVSPSAARLAQDELAYAGRWTLDARARNCRRGRAASAALPGERHLPRARRRGTVDVSVDGRPVKRSPSPAFHGCTRSRGFRTLKRGLLELRFSPGVEGYAFTFG